MTILSALRSRFQPAIAALGVNPDKHLALIQPAGNPQFGDYQANCAMPLGKELGRSPREVAQALLEALDVADFCHAPEIAGPGFVNLRLRDDWITASLQARVPDARLGIPPVSAPRRYVVDFSSPNVAKPMHVGHIRSTVLGDALTRILRFVGHDVVTDNHLGDWGTQFGMILYGYKHFLNAPAYAQDPVQELGRLYRLVRYLMDVWDAREELPKLESLLAAKERELKTASETAVSDKSQRKVADKLASEIRDLQEKHRSLAGIIARANSEPETVACLASHADIRQSVLDETARLHAGDVENRQLWAQFLPNCRDEIQGVYDRLGIRFDHELGESFYQDRLAHVVASLEAKGMAQISEGAVCVFLEGFDTPMLIRKRDGAFLYATSDLATIEYRLQEWNPDSILYVVDVRQGEHFEKLFAAARRWGYQEVDLRHVSFGTILGPDNRPFKTRAGDTVGLVGLLDEAERRATEVLVAHDAEKPETDRLSPAERQRIARVVGIAALKYADLSQNRTSDYVFSYDKMLSLQGNTATYLQYSYARVHGILQKGQIDLDQLRDRASGMLLAAPAERDLGLRLMRFGDALEDTLVDYRPNLLTNYLFDLAKGFSAFFEQCPVLKAETEALRSSRLLLCDMTARTIKRGLDLLGIDVVERM